MDSIADMFAELDGYQRYAVALEQWGAWRKEQRRSGTPRRSTERDRDRWRKSKRLARASGDAPSRARYAARYKTDAAFRQRRLAYWRDYHAKRQSTDADYRASRVKRALEYTARKAAA